MIVNPFDWGRLLQSTAAPPAIFAAMAPTKKSAVQPQAAASALSSHHSLEEILAEVTAVAAAVVGAEVGNSLYVIAGDGSNIVPCVAGKVASGSDNEANY